MNYSGNMPDWHQYNASQTNEVTPSTQNVNSGHLAFIPGVSPPTLNAISLNSEGLNKHQNDTSYNPRNFQSFNNVTNGSTIPNNSPLASMVQMQNCIGHYGSQNTRNPMLDNINASVDPRSTTIGTINDEIGYRSNQVPFNGPIGHLNGPNCNLNTPPGPRTGPGPIPGSRTNSGPGLGTNPSTGTGPIFGPGPRHGPASGHGSGSGPGNMGPRNTNIGSLQPPGKPGPSPSFIPCKGLCCNSDPNIGYQQWEKFGSYQQNNGSYRDNVHPSSYQMENRHFGNSCNFRKDNLDGKEVMGSVLPNTSSVDHRRNFADYKYHKDHLVHRNYSSSGMFHNYSMQGYNYSTDHQKYTYSMKEHTKPNNLNMSNSGMLKHQEQNFMAQQKFNNKQYQYQNGNMLPKGVPTLNVNANMASSSQNPYFNSQFQRNISTEMSHECQETADNTAMMNRMQGTFMHSSPPQHQMYQHKIAMQKFSIENHLRELSRIPGYQSHPKYKECVLRYREVLKLQQSCGYQNPVQQTPRVATPVNTAVAPINLQFDQNGMLINSSYLPDNFPKLQHAPTVEQVPENVDKQNKDQDIAMVNDKCQQSQQSEQLMIPQQNEHVPSSCAETFQKQNQFSMHKDFNQNQLKVQTNESHNFDTLSTNTSNEKMMEQKASKEFANKPDLDVRQFLANWDETDDEEGTANLTDTALNETTPVVVVSYENIDLSSKTPQSTEIPPKNSYCSNGALENEKESETNIIATQDCLTISYSASDNSETAKTSKRTIGEGVVKPGSIIHCISNGPDEIPTIHIVDNLEISNILGAPNDQVIQTLEKQQKAISFFRESSNNETETMALENTRKHNKSDTHILPTDYATSLDDVSKNASIEHSNISKTIQTTSISMNNQELRVLSTSEKDNLEVSDNMELKKQHSFEESHNPDDISLPDLPTSECTPISTTLNTPIHSDSEESSQNMEDLSISTNPIEVMQNSPVISFTQLNSEDKIKNRSLGTLELEYQKENRYKSSETSSSHEQKVTLDNFDFSNDSKAKSNEAIKNKQMKSLGTNTARKKVCLIDSRESDSRVSDACGILTSMEYELKVRQEAIEGEKSSNHESLNYTHERKHKSIRRSAEAMGSGIQSGDANDNIIPNVNLSLTVSDDEAQALKNDKELFKRKKMKTSIVSTNAHCSTSSEVDPNARKKAKETIAWEDKSTDKYLNRNLTQKKDADNLKQSKVSDVRKFDDSCSSQDGEHSVCHMTSQCKHYSVAVIKDNVTLSDKRTHGTTDRIISEKSTEFPPKSSSTNTKEFPEEAEIKKRLSSKTVLTLHESIHSQTSKLLQKDLKTVDGDVRYTMEEMRFLKEYRKKKEKLYQTHDVHNDNNRDEKSKARNHKLECSQIRPSNEILAVHKICSEQNSVSSIGNLNSENPMAQEETKNHSCSKNLVKNTDFGIQVANVNLKIKDNDIGKELILGDNNQEHVKDSLEGIKIEINVSCTDRNLKGQEQNKRLLYGDHALYEIDNSLSYSNTLDCQRRLHVKDQEDNSKLSERAYRAFEKSDAAVDAMKTNQAKNEAEKLRLSFKKDRRSSLEPNDEVSSIISKETCDLISDSQSLNKSLRNSVSSKDISKTDVIEATNYTIDHMDIAKTKSAISNTAIIDVNNKVKGKNKVESDREDNSIRTDDDQAIKVQKQGSTSFVDVSDILEKELTSVPHSNISTKLPESSLVELRAKSLHGLSNLDFKFSKYGVDLDHSHHMGEGLEEEGYTGKWKKPKIDDIFEDCDMFQSSSGYVNPIFSSIDKLEDLHTVPIYTTKDGKISYSPNRRFTYHELMMEARKREPYSSAKKTHYTETWNNYYNSKFRKLYKRKRHHGFSDRKKYEYKDTKYLYDRKRNYSDEFCDKSHVKYKDYIHSIRNNNAVWSDYCKIDRIYSSSDSDEQIIDCNKNRNTNSNSCKNDQATEDKIVTISKSHEDEVVVNELDIESKNKANDVIDDLLDKDKNTNLEETPPVQIETLDIEKNDKDNESTANNYTSNCISNLQSDTLSNSLESNHEEQNIEYLQVNENKNSINEGVDETVDKVENRIIPENEENVDSKNESSISDLLHKESLLDEENQVSDLCNLEEERNDDKMVSEKTDVEDQKEKDDTKMTQRDTYQTCETSIEAENNFANIECTEDNKTLETVEINISEGEIFVTEEITELQVDPSDELDQVSQEFLELETSDDVFSEMVDECEKNISQSDVLECQEEIVQFGEEVEIPSEDQKQEESISNVEEKNIEVSKQQNDNNSSKVESLADHEESESPVTLTDITTDQEDNSQHNSVDINEREHDFNANSNQVNNMIVEEQNFIGFSKDEIHTEDKNIDEIVDVLNEEEIGIVRSNTEEIPAEQAEGIDSSKSEGESSDFTTGLGHKVNLDQDSLVEKEIAVFDTYSITESSVTTNAENSKGKTEEDKEEQKQHLSLEQTSCNSSTQPIDSNVDLKVIPKLVIKKTDPSNSKSECILDYTDSCESYNRYDAKLLSEARPKIPKVIIMKNRSRSVTPTAELLDKAKSDKTQSLHSQHNDESVDVDNSDFESYTLKYNNYENKVPKVRIKLEDISTKDLKLYLKRKATKKSVPKMRIKKFKMQESKRVEMEDSLGTEVTDSDEEDKNCEKSMTSDTEIEKVPKLKLKKQEECNSLVFEKNKMKDSNILKASSKRTRRTKEEDSKHTAKYDGALINEELKKKFPQCIIEKVPKVIIKRTQIGTEFKCEISKSKRNSITETSKWQPKVKLQRLDILDYMVKDLKQSKIILKDKFNSPTRVNDNTNDTGNENVIDNSEVKLCRSSSASDLSPTKCKHRRLSDCDYTKMSSKSITEFDENLGEPEDETIFKSNNSEGRNFKKEEEKKFFSQSRQVYYSQDNVSENEMREAIMKHSFRDILRDEDNDLLIMKKEYSSFETKENGLFTGDRFLESPPSSHNYNDNNGSIIKVDSSDESQTTIEILPASPNNIDDETKDFEFENTDEISMEDAIPTQLELELELIDNNNICSGILASKIDYASHSKSKYTNDQSTKTYFNEYQHSPPNTFDQNEYTSSRKQQLQNSEKESNDYFYCNDLLVKEVLAAKETLKKCLSRPESEDVERSKLRLRTVAEKKQGLSFSFNDLETSVDKSDEVCSNSENDKVNVSTICKNSEKKGCRSPCRTNEEEAEESCFKQDKIYSLDCPTASTHEDSSVVEPTTISLKASKKFDETMTNKITDDSDLSNKHTNNTEELQEAKFKKKTSNSRGGQKDNDNSSNTKTKEDNMPLLVPEVALNFDSSSDRDSSRSPPVITNQEEVEHVVEDAKLMESKVISQIEKMEENKKHSYKDCKMTISDIITQLAYHEKATIKHKRYCNLCERWFPTTSRHRRHLAGYQHRYMELTQRKSIHALFILFTGKPCPRLLPANVIRSDCSIGELTPLQIAVQDVANCVEYTQQNHKTKE